MHLSSEDLGGQRIVQNARELVPMGVTLDQWRTGGWGPTADLG